MLVVDANVLAYFLIEGDKTAQARSLHQFDPDWRAPMLISYELTSVLVQYMVQGGIQLETAEEVLGTGLRCVSFLDAQPAPYRVLQIASRLQVSAYDACYLAAAESLDVPLVSEDGRLLRVAPEIVRPLDAFV